MGLWSRLIGKERAEKKSAVFERGMQEFFNSRRSTSGVDVNWQSAIQVSTVFACLRVIAEGVAQVPLTIKRELPDGKGSVPATEHPLYRVLNSQPNKWQTSFALRETLIYHCALTGSAFFYKNIVGGRVKELIPLDPGSVSITRNPDMSLTYHVTFWDGTSVNLSQDLVWHVRGPSWDTWNGMNAAVQAREAIGLAIATERSQAEMHANGVQPSGIYSTDKTLSPTDYDKIQKWIANQVGGDNKHKPFIIDSGFKWTAQSMTGVDAEHLDTRKFQIEEICRAFRVLPPMVGHSGQAMTFASAEQIFLAHVVHTLTPWVVRIEQSIDNDLLNASGDEKYFAHFAMNSLQRGAFKDRFEGYARSLGAGGSPAWMTPNEVRAAEEMNAIDGGDELPKPVNNQPSSVTQKVGA